MRQTERGRSAGGGNDWGGHSEYQIESVPGLDCDWMICGRGRACACACASACASPVRIFYLWWLKCEYGRVLITLGTLFLSLSLATVSASTTP